MNIITNLNKRLIETTSFTSNNFLQSYDKNVFSKKASFDFLIDNQKIKMKIVQTTDSTLQDYSILIMKSGQKKMKLIFNSQEAPVILKSEMSSQEWKSYFMIYHEMHQEIGDQVNVTLADLQRKATAFEPENMQKDMGEKELQITAYQKADEIAAEFFTQEANLEEEMGKCGLTPENIETIKHYSAGASDITDFLIRSASVKLPKESTIIGLNHKDIIPGVKEALNCEDYLDAYERIFQCFTARDDFLEKLTEEQRPVIFLVPHKLLGPKRGVTAQEMEWLLDHPESMANVHFVFRAYKTYSAKIISSTGLTNENAIDSYRMHLTTRIFQQIQVELRLPKIQNFDPLLMYLELSTCKRQFELLLPKPFVKLPKLSRLTFEETVETRVALSNMPKLLPLTFVDPENGQQGDLRKLEAPRAVFLVGGCGAGKGTVRELIQKSDSLRNYAVIDPDAIKEALPEYQAAIKNGNMNAAIDVHERSVKIATSSLVEMIKVRKDFIYDSTGRRFWVYEEQMAAAKSQGMFVELIYVKTKVEICLERALKRETLTGRRVPEDSIRSSNKSAKDAFADLQEFAHRSIKYKNNGSSPQLVATIEK